MGKIIYDASSKKIVNVDLSPKEKEEINERNDELEFEKNFEINEKEIEDALFEIKVILLLTELGVI